jgi:hypothetical protein
MRARDVSEREGDIKNSEYASSVHCDSIVSFASSATMIGIVLVDNDDRKVLGLLDPGGGDTEGFMRGVLEGELEAAELMGERHWCDVAATRPIDWSGLGSGIKLPLRDFLIMARFLLRRPVGWAGLGFGIKLPLRKALVMARFMLRRPVLGWAFATKDMGLDLLGDGLDFFVATTRPRKSTGLWFEATLG